MKTIITTIDNKMSSRLDIEQETIPTEYYEQGYKFLDETTEVPIIYNEDRANHITIDVTFVYNEITDTFVTTYTKVVSALLVQSAINKLQNQLTSTDYQITKTNEYSLVGLPLPYEIQQLHIARQLLRDKINQLETLIG